MSEPSELTKFKQNILSKSKVTQGVYVSNYKKLRELLQDEDIASCSQKRVIDVVQDIDNRNSQQALINVAFLIRRYEEMGINELDAYRKKNEVLIREKKFETNEALAEKLPAYDTLVDYVDSLLKAKKYIQYIINYLLLYYQVRNADLIFDFVVLKKDTKDKSKNYLWLNARMKRVHYIRNVYKTAKIIKSNGKDAGYGQKAINITDPVFVGVMKLLAAEQKKENKPIVFFPITDNIGYYIKKMTYENLGETLIFKAVVNHFRDNVNMLKQIEFNRGATIKVILDSYDVESEPINEGGAPHAQLR
ncbi:MAG: hypothetical protein EBV05_09400 [Cyanobacteria bacterium WB6_1B_304]|nr:hypothetical protein [Cyanobacteria bacterium WB6_1B_304]